MSEKRDGRKKDADSLRTVWKVLKFSPQEWTVLTALHAIWRKGKGEGRRSALSKYIRAQLGL